MDSKIAEFLAEDGRICFNAVTDDSEDISVLANIDLDGAEEPVVFFYFEDEAHTLFSLLLSELENLARLIYILQDSLEENGDE